MRLGEPTSPQRPDWLDLEGEGFLKGISGMFGGIPFGDRLAQGGECTALARATDAAEVQPVLMVTRAEVEAGLSDCPEDPLFRYLFFYFLQVILDVALLLH